MLTHHQLEKFGKKLHALRADFDAKAPALRAEACQGAGGEDSGGLSNTPVHLGDLGSQEAAAVVNVGLAANEATLRREIEEAIVRLDHGEFGLCENCGRAIAPERLEAVPYSRFCIACAEQQQQAGRF